MSMQLALLKAGLITQEQYDAGQRREEKQAEKDRQKMVKAGDPVSKNPFHSMRSMIDHIKKELRQNPTPGNLGRLIKQAHQLADQLKVKDKRRKKMHAFLAKVGEGLVSRTDHQEKMDFLDEVFLQLDPKLVSE